MMTTEKESLSSLGLPLDAHRWWGAVVEPDGSTRFRVWAPALESLRLELQPVGDSQSRFEITHRVERGFFERRLDGCPDGTRYRYVMPNGNLRPDPASRFQPEGVHGWSQVSDARAYAWGDGAWRGVPKSDLVIYELHAGTFTEQGTWLGAIDRLDELIELGVTAIELMPIAESPGRWNWGYDGVDLFAPRRTFGTPEELRQLVDAAHQRGLAVLLDVVYNHLGPEGNYWAEFGPYLSTRHRTPWGDAPNFDEDGSDVVRAFIIANATYWIDEFHFDGLRVDAVHCMADERDPHIVTEIGDAIAAMRARSGRELHLIAESNVYDPQILQAVDSGGHGWDALWCDDFLHSVFAILRPGDHMSSRHYHPHVDLDATLQRGFVFQGTLRQARRRRTLEETSGEPPVALNSLVFAIQNHDFIGNHPQGQRLHQVASPAAQKAAAALLMLYPAIPMLFMGEEFACPNPFYFFVDFTDQHLRAAVEQGRRREYPQHDWNNVASPLAPEAFEHSRIGAAAKGDRQMYDWYRSLIALRKQWKSQRGLAQDALSAHWDEQGHFARLSYGEGEEARFVIVRLHSEDVLAPPLILSGVRKLLLHQNCEPQQSGEGIPWRLGDCGVAIGEGEVGITLA
jgi:maltooligosyltrehalose trehalohydrolase